MPRSNLHALIEQQRSQQAAQAVDGGNNTTNTTTQDVHQRVDVNATNPTTEVAEPRARRMPAPIPIPGASRRPAPDDPVHQLSTNPMAVRTLDPRIEAQLAAISSGFRRRTLTRDTSPVVDTRASSQAHVTSPTPSAAETSPPATTNEAEEALEMQQRAVDARVAAHQIMKGIHEGKVAAKDDSWIDRQCAAT